MLSLANLTGLATLARVDGAVVIGRMPSLATIALPEATSVGDVSITDNALLTQVTWDVSDQMATSPSRTMGGSRRSSYR
jgi:hypothetical protein